MILALALFITADHQAIIWGGGKTEAEAQAALKGLDAVPVDLGKGFPLITKSDDVPGLKPGFVVVIAGYCPKHATPLALFKLFNKGAYDRTVQPKDVAADACPVKRSGVLALDLDAVSGKERFGFAGYSPGSCGNTPPSLTGLAVSARLKNAKKGGKITFELHTSTAYVTDEEGIQQCDDSKISFDEKATVSAEKPKRTFEWSGEWPCAVKIVARYSENGKAIDELERAFYVGSCYE